MSSKKGSSSSGGLFRPLAIMGALAGLVYWQLPQLKYLNYWVRAKKLNIEDFAAADFKVNTDIPTTYYEPGEIASVLKEWDHRFHLYRVKPTSKFTYDKSLLESNILARKLDYSCLEEKENECNRFSVLSTNCVFDLNNTHGIEDVIPVPKILSPEGRGWHASFATMESHGVVRKLWDSMKFPFSVDSTNFEHAFISHLPQDGITAAFHANPATDSMAVTFEGHKTWLFLPSYVYRDMMDAHFGASSIFLTRAPPKNSKPEVFIYTSQPGDVLFFPEAWGHAVHTYAGPNFMINYRKMWLGNILHQPLTWVSAIFFNTFFKYSVTNKNPVAADIIKKKAFSAVPTKELNVKIVDLFTNLCKENNGRVGFDNQMVELIENEVKRFKATM